ncbi:MAG: hypothetical protein ACE5FO_14010 [Parvularculaceae bacterium]
MISRNRLFFGLAAAAGLSAAAAGAAARAEDGGNAINDVQIGERGMLTRIAVICRRPCLLESRAGRRFFLEGADESMKINLAERSRNLEALSVEPVEGGSIVSVRAVGRLQRARPKACRIDGAPAACVDLQFAPAAPADQTSGATPRAVEGLREAAAKPASIPVPQENADPPPAPPILRDGEEASLVAPPERLSAPRPPARADSPRPGEGPTLAAAKPVLGRAFGATRGPETPKERRPVLRTEGLRTLELDEPAPSDFAGAARAILGKQLTSAECAASEAILEKDAWALDAMIDVGFCKAAAGALEEADGVFKRLLAYTPDNYEALVGRALIAQEAGEKSVARKYFQDALNALPPIEESNRIVEAMNRL